MNQEKRKNILKKHLEMLLKIKHIQRIKKSFKMCAKKK